MRASVTDPAPIPRLSCPAKGVPRQAGITKPGAPARAKERHKVNSTWHSGCLLGLKNCPVSGGGNGRPVSAPLFGWAQAARGLGVDTIALKARNDIMEVALRAPPDAPAVCVSRSVEETRRPEMGELSALPSTYDLVSHHRAQEWRHRHAAMGDGDIVAGSPRHRSDGRQLVAGDRPDGDAHRLRFDLADRGKQLSGAPRQIARLWHQRAKLRVEAQWRRPGSNAASDAPRHQGARRLRWCGPHGSSWRRQGA